MPTQEGPKGSASISTTAAACVLPEGEHPWQVRLSDLDTGNILFETEIKGGRINSTKRYYVRFRSRSGSRTRVLLSHEYSAPDREVLIQFPVGTLGDTMGWFPYAVKFQEQHGCRLTCAMGEKLIPLFRDAYPDITFVTHEEVKPERYYATYSMGLFFDDKDCIFQPCDFRYVGLHRTAGYILGVDPTEEPPRIALADDSRPIAEPYVCIAVQSTTQAKYWNNPTGWREIVAFLKDAGYRVICIDQKPMHGTGLVWNHIPHGVEDETGDQPLAGARALAEARRVLRRPVERAVLARLGGGHAGGDDRGLHPSDQRVRHALPRDQLSHLQQLLERSAPPLRPQGLPVVPAPRQHAAPVRMHAADHGRSREAGDPAHPWLRPASADPSGAGGSRSRRGPRRLQVGTEEEVMHSVRCGGCHAPLQAGHPVIPMPRVAAKSCQIERRCLLDRPHARTMTIDNIVVAVGAGFKPAPTSAAQEFQKPCTSAGQTTQ